VLVVNNCDEAHCGDSAGALSLSAIFPLGELYSKDLFPDAPTGGEFPSNLQLLVVL
jgi:hypothetical protein